MNISEILNHLGEDREQYFNAISPPVIQSSNFAFPDLHQFRAAFADELNQHVYSRGNNPTVEILRKKLAALEGTEDALVFSSGAGAIAAAVIGNVQAGDAGCDGKKLAATFNRALRLQIPRVLVSWSSPHEQQNYAFGFAENAAGFNASGPGFGLLQKQLRQRQAHRP